MTTYKHPKADEIRQMAYLISNDKRRAAFSGKLEALLAVYAENGSVTRQNVGPELLGWLRSTWSNFMLNRVSAETRALLSMFDIASMFASRTPRAVRKSTSSLDFSVRPMSTSASAGVSSSGAQSLDDETVQMEAKKLQLQRIKDSVNSRLARLYPSNLVSLPTEPLVTTVWWAFMWEWRDQAGKQVAELNGNLREFIDVTRQMRQHDLLSALQLDLVDTLERRSVHGLSGEKRLEMVG